MSASSSVALITVSSPALARSEDPKFPTPECPPPAICSRPDLAARLDAFWREWHWRWNLTKDASEEEVTAIEKQDGAFFEKEATLVDEIAEMRVQTMADVILQARACALSNVTLWIDPFEIEQMHSGERITRSLVDGICKLHDIDPIPHGKLLPMDKEPIPLETVPSADPIFAAIDAQRCADRELDAHLSLDEDLHDDDVIDDLSAKDIAATDALFRTEPRTPAGREALIRRAIQVIDARCVGDRNENVPSVTCGQLVALLRSLSEGAAVAVA